MERRLLSLLKVGILVALLMTMFAVPETGSSKAIELKAITFLPVADFQNRLFVEFIDRVNKQSKGELVVKLVGGPEAIPPFDQPEAIRTGVVDLGMIPGSYFVRMAPEFFANGIAELPPWELRKTGWNDVLNEIAKKKANVFYLGYAMWEQRGAFFLNKRIEKIEDFIGLKIRGPESAQPFIRALGASPVSMPTGEIYTALERGLIDGYSAGWTHVIGKGGLYRVVKYIVNHPFGRSNVAVLINVQTFERLPKHLQDLMKDLMVTLEHEMTPFYKGTWVKLQNDPGKYNMELINLPPADAKRFSEIFTQSAWEYMDKAAPGWDRRLKDLSVKK